MNPNTVTISQVSTRVFGHGSVACAILLGFQPRAVSSVEEHRHNEPEVAGSTPAPPTNRQNGSGGRVTKERAGSVPHVQSNQQYHWRLG